ncbi:NAD(+) diphosphatase [Luteimonas soli]|uniref:NAD(+) diphosphatase n=1 Tax=Luteimonas soli TaxID=1648966 RepID=A0ABV7XHD8_9GAMM
MPSLPVERTPAFAFLESPLDRAEHLRDDAGVLAARWPLARVVVVDVEGRAAADADGAPLRLHGADIAPADDDAPLFLGLRDDEAWFAVRAANAADVAIPRWIDLRTAAAGWPAFEATAFAQARAVLHWQARHRYCGACGTALEYRRAGWLGWCPRCELEHYPRTDPAVIVAITDGSRLLLGRNPGWPPHRYSTLAGFVEPGESLEQTVEREVLEESGVRILRCRYLASQPWPFPSSLMLGFFAEAAPDEPQVGDELEDARWFTFDEVDAALRGDSPEGGLLLSPSVSISRWLVEYWHAAMATQG